MRGLSTPRKSHLLCPDLGYYTQGCTIANHKSFHLRQGNPIFCTISRQTLWHFIIIDTLNLTALEDNLSITLSPECWPLPVDDGNGGRGGGGNGIKPNWAKPEMCEIESRSPIGEREQELGKEKGEAGRGKQGRETGSDAALVATGERRTTSGGIGRICEGDIVHVQY